MLMNINCSAVTSVAVHLKFDDNTCKDRIIAKDDLIEVDFNHNGVRKHVIGKVIKISTATTDPKGWFIIVDGSDDFEANQFRFCPMNILDVEILRRAGENVYIETPRDNTGIYSLRIIKGRLQYSKDGVNWSPVKYDRRDMILDEEGTVPDLGLNICDGILDEEGSY